MNVIKLVHLLKAKPEKDLSEDNVETLHQLLDDLVMAAQTDVLNETINKIKRFSPNQKNKIDFN